MMVKKILSQRFNLDQFLGVVGEGETEGGVGWRSCRVFSRTLGSHTEVKETKDINQIHKRKEVLKLERMRHSEPKL